MNLLRRRRRVFGVAGDEAKGWDEDMVSVLLHYRYSCCIHVSSLLALMTDPLSEAFACRASICIACMHNLSSKSASWITRTSECFLSETTSPREAHGTVCMYRTSKHAPSLLHECMCCSLLPTHLAETMARGNSDCERKALMFRRTLGLIAAEQLTGTAYFRDYG